MNHAVLCVIILILVYYIIWFPNIVIKSLFITMCYTAVKIIQNPIKSSNINTSYYGGKSKNTKLKNYNHHNQKQQIQKQIQHNNQKQHIQKQIQNNNHQKQQIHINKRESRRRSYKEFLTKLTDKDEKLKVNVLTDSSDSSDTDDDKFDIAKLNNIKQYIRPNNNYNMDVLALNDYTLSIFERNKDKLNQTLQEIYKNKFVKIQHVENTKNLIKVNSSNSKNSNIQDKVDLETEKILTEEPVDNIDLKITLDMIEKTKYNNTQFSHVIRDSDKEMQYYRRNNEFKYVTHWGQLKLLLSEIQFLTIALQKITNSKKFVFVYAGAATGEHIPYLRNLFPTIDFLLYDPAKFNIKESEGIKIINDYFLDKTAFEIKEKYRDCNILFCSDIRTEDSSDDNNPFNTSELDIQENMKMQFGWWKIMEPDLAMFKFRLPFDKNKSNYPEGMICIQAFCGAKSTETRLIVEKNAKYISYDNNKYESQLFYHNVVNRKSEFDIIGPLDLKTYDVCNCYDCTLFIFIIRDYLLLRKNEVSRDEILDKIKEVIKHTNLKLPRTLYEQTVYKLNKHLLYLTQHISNNKSRKLERNAKEVRANTKDYVKKNIRMK